MIEDLEVLKKEVHQSSLKVKLREVSKQLGRIMKTEMDLFRELAQLELNTSNY
jgi:hypothetical protein